MRPHQAAINHVRPNALRTLLSRVTGPADPALTTDGVANSSVNELAEFFCYGPDRGAIATRRIDALLARHEHQVGPLLEAVARQLGEAWHTDACSFATVSIAMTRLQMVFNRFAHTTRPIAPTQRGTGTVLLTLPPGEQHLLGLSITEYAFACAGWKTRVLQPRSMTHFAGFLKEQTNTRTIYDAICLSWSSSFLIGQMTKMLRVLRDHHAADRPLILAGGYASDRNGSLLSRFGVTHAAGSGLAAVSLAQELTRRTGTRAVNIRVDHACELAG